MSMGVSSAATAIRTPPARTPRPPPRTRAGGRRRRPSTRRNSTPYWPGPATRTTRAEVGERWTPSRGSGSAARISSPTPRGMGLSSSIPLTLRLRARAAAGIAGARGGLHVEVDGEAGLAAHGDVHQPREALVPVGARGQPQDGVGPRLQELHLRGVEVAAGHHHDGEAARRGVLAQRRHQRSDAGQLAVHDHDVGARGHRHHARVLQAAWPRAAPRPPATAGCGRGPAPARPGCR